MAKTMQESMDEKKDGDDSPTDPWYVRLVRKEGIATVLLLMIASFVIPAVITYLRTASEGVNAVSKYECEQSATLTHLANDMSKLAEAGANSFANSKIIIDNQRKLEAISSSLEKLVILQEQQQKNYERLIDHLNRQDAAPASPAPPASKGT